MTCNNGTDHIVGLTITYAAPGEEPVEVATAALHTESQEAAANVFNWLSSSLMLGGESSHIVDADGETLFEGTREDLVALAMAGEDGEVH